MKAGFDRKLARQIGAAAQDLDLDDGDAMHGGGANSLNMNLYYFVSPARLHGVRRDAFSGAYLDPGWLGLVGEFIHAWEDSYSHQEDPVRQDFGKQFHDEHPAPFNDQDIGHGMHKHEPNWTWERPELALTMA